MIDDDIIQRDVQKQTDFYARIVSIARFADSSTTFGTNDNNDNCLKGHNSSVYRL